MEDRLLHMRISYDLTNGGRIEEKAAFQQRPTLVQKTWSWQEFKEEALQREYKSEFNSGPAMARKREKEGLKV